MNKEIKEITLASILDDPKKKNFITSNKINLTYCDITSIGQIPLNYLNISRLHLSHNRIENLDGIEEFLKLNYVSLGYNKIKNWKELMKITNKNDIQEIIVNGNPLDLNPNYMFNLYDNFPNITKIDDTLITNEDKKILNKYVAISSMLLPFFIKIDTDQKIIEKYLNILKSITEGEQQVYDQSENPKIGGAFGAPNNAHNFGKSITNPFGNALGTTLKNAIEEKLGKKEFGNVLDNHERDIDKIKKLINELFDELKNDIINLDIDKITREHGFKSYKSVQTLKNIKKLITSTYPDLDKFVIPSRQILYETYKYIFNEIMLRYYGANDKTFDFFLTQEVIQNKHYDFERFANDTFYAFDCILYEFYKLMPVQASLGNNVAIEFNGIGRIKKAYSQNLSHRNRHDEMITSVDIDYNDPSNLKNLSLTNFPLFPLNCRFMNFVLDVIVSRLEFFEKIVKDLNNIIKNSVEPKKYDYEKTKTTFRDSMLSYSFSPKSVDFEDRIKEKADAINVSDMVQKTESKMTTNRFLLKSPKKLVHENLKETEDNKDSQKQSIKIDLKSISMIKKEEEKCAREKEERMREKFILPIIVFMKLEANADECVRYFLSNLKEYSMRKKELSDLANLKKKMIEKRLLSMEKSIEKFQKRKIFYTLISRLKRIYTNKIIIKHYKNPLKRNILRVWNNYIEEKKKKFTSYYDQNLIGKVFYGLLNAKFIKKHKFKVILERLSRRTKTTLNFYLSKWKIISVASKFLTPKANINTLENNLNIEFSHKSTKNTLMNHNKIPRPSSKGGLQNFSKEHGIDFYDDARSNKSKIHNNRDENLKNLNRSQSEDKSFETNKSNSSKNREILKRMAKKYGQQPPLGLKLSQYNNSFRRSPSLSSIFRKCAVCDYNI